MAKEAAKAPAKAAPAATAAKAKSGWVDLGTLRKKKDGKAYLVIDKRVEILVDGEAVDLGEFRTIKLLDPVAGLNTRLENGNISEADHQKQLDFIEEKNVKYRITVAPSTEN